jgi:hypothetical protein
MDPMPEFAQPGDTPTDADDRRRIGEVFVELGFVTSEQLDAALAMQRRTGKRLGEILVEHGSLSRLDLASALAEHWEPRRPARGTRPELSLRPLGGAAPTASPVPGPKALEALEARLSALEQRLEAGEQASPEASAQSAEEQLRADLRALAERLERLEAVTQEQPRPTGRIAAVESEGYVAFVPTATGYRLVTRSEAPPEPGTTLMLEDEESPLVVVRYGRSPLPFDARPCAYLATFGSGLTLHHRGGEM